MGLFRGNLIWIAATAVVGFGAGTALVLIKPAPLFVTQEPRTEAAGQDVSENARVLAALQALETARDAQEVTREAPVDLLEVAPQVPREPAPEAPRAVETVDAAASAAFFNAAQDELAAHDTCGDDLRALAAGPLLRGRASTFPVAGCLRPMRGLPRHG